MEDESTLEGKPMLRLHEKLGKMAKKRGIKRRRRRWRGRSVRGREKEKKKVKIFLEVCRKEKKAKKVKIFLDSW